MTTSRNGKLVTRVFQLYALKRAYMFIMDSVNVNILAPWDVSYYSHPQLSLYVLVVERLRKNDSFAVEVKLYFVVNLLHLCPVPVLLGYLVKPQSMDLFFCSGMAPYCHNRGWSSPYARLLQVME